VFSTELGIRLSFFKTSEFGGVGEWLNPQPPFGTLLRHRTYSIGQTPEPSWTWCDKENFCRCQKPNLFYHPVTKWDMFAHCITRWLVMYTLRCASNVCVRTAEADLTCCGSKKPVYLAACHVKPHAWKVFVWYIPFKRPAALTVTMTHVVRLFQLSSHTALSNVHFTHNYHWSGV
jgi:hypothetical protein